MGGESDSHVNDVHEHKHTLVSFSRFLFWARLHIRAAIRCVLFSSQYYTCSPQSLETQWKHSRSSVDDCNSHRLARAILKYGNQLPTFFSRSVCVILYTTAKTALTFADNFQKTSRKQTHPVQYAYKNNSIFRLTDDAIWWHDMSKCTFIFPWLMNDF